MVTPSAAYSKAKKAASYIGPCNFSNRRVYKPFNQGTQNIGSDAVQTIGATIALESDFNRVRLTLYNTQTANTITVTGACVAASIDALSGSPAGVTPTNASGVADSTVWKQCTYNGAAGPWTVPAATIGTNNVIPGTLQLDWTIVQSLPRADGSANPLLLYRIATSTAATLNTVLGPAGALTTGWPLVNGGRFFQSYGSSGSDNASSAQAGWGASVRDTVSPAVTIETQGGKRGITLMTCGDSTFQGADTTAGQNNFGHQAALLASGSKYAVSHINVGFAGQQHAYIYQNALAALALFKPDILIFEGMSPNDAYNTANMELALGRCADIIDQCIRVGTVQIISTAIPWGGSSGTALTTAQEAVRVSFNNTIRSWANYGTIIFDADAVLTNGAAIASIKPAYRVYDGTAVTPDAGGQHPDNNGHAAQAAALVPIIQRIASKLPVTS